MNRIKFTTAAALMLSGLLAGAASAQDEAVVRHIELAYLMEEGPMDAMILEKKVDERTLTVRLEETEEIATLIVPENAEILRTFPNNLEREIELSDLDVGDELTVEGVEVEGVVRLRIIGIAS